MTDLHRVKDHPARLLDDTDPNASEALDLYQVDHDVTFAALDNDTLDAIREVYDREPDLTGMSGKFNEDLARYELERLYELESLISDLLGLED